MKPTNLIIIVLSVVCVILTFKVIQLTSKDLISGIEPKNDSTLVEKLPPFFYNQAMNKAKQAMRKADPKAGKFITNQQAQVKMNAFNKFNKNPQSDIPYVAPYSFGFGLETIKEYIAKIENYNNTLSVDSLKLEQVNIYLTASNNSAFGSYLDCLWIPVQSDGELIYKNTVSNGIATKVMFHDHDLILNSSDPCPPNCPHD